MGDMYPNAYIIASRAYSRVNVVVDGKAAFLWFDKPAADALLEKLTNANNHHPS